MTDLHWGWSEGEDLVTSPLGVAVHVDEDVNAVSVDTVGSLAIARDLWRRTVPVSYLLQRILDRVCTVIKK